MTVKNYGLPSFMFFSFFSFFDLESGMMGNFIKYNRVKMPFMT